jgi:hypothetical protein
MQSGEPQQTRITELAQSQTVPALNHHTIDVVAEEKPERPVRSGFFSNYKASKSASRLHNTESKPDLTDDKMSRDTVRPAMSGKVSSQEPARSGKTLLFRMPLRTTLTNCYWHK